MAAEAATGIGIASAVSVLQSLLQCYKDFLVARDFPEDYITIQLQLLLLQRSTRSWGVAVGLIDEDGTSREQFRVSSCADDGIKLIKASMSHIKDLLDEANKALDKYTVTESHESGHTDETSHLAADSSAKISISQRLVQKMKRTFRQEHDQQHPGIVKRTTWALVSKERIEKSVQDITNLVAQLQLIFKPLDTKKQYDSYETEIKTMGLADDELATLTNIAGTVDKILKQVAEKTIQERNASNSFEVSGNGIWTAGDYIAPDFDPSKIRTNARGSHFDNFNIKVGDDAVATTGTQFGGKTAVQLKLEQRERERAEIRREEREAKAAAAATRH